MDTNEATTVDQPQPPAPTAPKSADAPFDPLKFRGVGVTVQPEAPAEAPEQEAPAAPETPEQPAEAPAPAEQTEVEASTSEEFNFDAYVAPDKGTAQQKPPTPQEAEVLSAVLKELGIKATKPEDIIKEIKSREKEAVENYRNDPVAKIDKLLTQDKTVITTAYYMEKYGMNQEQAKKYVETVIEKKGAGELDSEAFIATTHFENKRDRIEANRESIESANEARDLELQSEFKSIIAAQKAVFTVPVEQGNNDKFSQWFFSGGFAQAVQNPNTLVETARFMFEKNSILKTVADKAMQKGIDKGFEQAKAEYEKKIFNKDTRTAGSTRGEQKNNGTKKAGAFDPAKFISNAINGVQKQPQQ